MWEVKERVLSKMTPRLLTWGEREMKELSMGIEKLWSLFNVDLVPIRISHVLLLFNLRKFEVNQDFVSTRQLLREDGGSLELGLVKKVELGVICVAKKVNLMFAEDITEGEKVKVKQQGTEPWGTPVVTGTGWEVNDFNWMNSAPERYEWNQLRGVLVIPIKESLSRRMVCEIVSKAALKSSRRRMDSKPESAAKRRSLLILRSAVSVLWRGRKPDWNCSCKLLQKRWVWSWAATIISRILEMNGRFEIGQKNEGCWDLNQVSW